MTTLSPLASRVIAIALLVVAIGLIVSVGIAPLVASSSRLGADLVETRGMIARFAAIAAAREAYEQQIAAFDAEQIEATVYLPGGSQGVAAASLQELVGLVAEGAGADLKSTQALPVAIEDGHERTGVRVVLECSVAALADVFAELESDVPFVFVANLDIEPRQGPRNDNGASDLLVRFDLYGYRKGLAE